MWGNMALPWQGRVTQQSDQTRPLHLSSNLVTSQGHTQRQEEDNLRMSNWLFHICMLHSETASQNQSSHFERRSQDFTLQRSVGRCEKPFTL